MKKVMMMVLLLAPLCIFAQKFGNVDSGSIIQLLPDYIQAQTDLQNLQKQYQDEFNYLQEELAKKSEDYQSQAETLPDNIKQRREQELEDLYSKMQQFAQDSQVNLNKVSQEKMESITTKVLKAIQEVGDEGGYTCIFDTADGVVPYVSKTATTDVTPLVKAKLGIN
ncbi:MAG: OmpH family outer membrane protein [Bacteroidaceae bacterium]|nr:OmpH family outer membrane protein [Bacteroidaceae bacterium]